MFEIIKCFVLYVFWFFVVLLVIGYVIGGLKVVFVWFMIFVFADVMTNVYSFIIIVINYVGDDIY